MIPAMRHILIADDTESKLKSMRRSVEAASPNSLIHAVGSVREATTVIGIIGDKIDTAVVDFDFEQERDTGETIVRALRAKNRRASIVCATARPEGESFDEASAFTLSAGANDALCFERADFESRLQAFIA